MSYIRSGNNPEKLYIWSDGKLVWIRQGYDDKGTIPEKIFNGLLKKYVKNCGEESSYKGASIKEILLSKDGKILKELNIHSPEYLSTLEGSKYQMFLSYKEVSVIMWGVTWDYIVNQNSFR